MTTSKSKVIERPGKVTAIATIVSGALNIIGACGATAALVVGTLGLA